MSRHNTTRRSTTRSSLNSARHGRAAAHGRACARPASAHQHRGNGSARGRAFDAPEVWHDPASDENLERPLKIVAEPAGRNYVHPVTADEVRARVLQLPKQFQAKLEVVQFSRMTRKRRLFPCYGLQWGTAVYLYPIEESLQELYIRAPRPAQRIETEMFGGRWVQDGHLWRLIWTQETIRDFYLNNVLIHEIGHINDDRNTSVRKREQFADWFAIEYGYRRSRRKPH